jgi:peptide/nickel transport system ATP-binding protein
MTANHLLAVNDLHISWKVDNDLIPIVDGVDFTLDTGRVLALVGESGCGKSVTALAFLQLLSKELKIVKGRILFQGNSDDKPVDIAALRPKGGPIRRIRGDRIAMIFQEPMSSFSPLHTVGAQIMEVIRLHLDFSKKQARALAVELFAKVGIADAARAVDAYPHEFSGGMRQRAMIAKALACNPAILIADEPTTALDVTIQAQILNVMREMQAEYGLAIIFISHDLGVVAQMAHEVAIMYMGKIVEKGSVRDIFKHARHPYTVNLLAAIPRLGNLEARKRLDPIQGTVPGLYDRPAGCTFSPRCDYSMPGTCDAAFPPFTEFAGGHQVACYLYP